ncbi:MAG: M1 family aminopeptidase [Chloroflexi bacterium]|nr:M1 family aminopeptidase [Chloroflexota bacterium]
MTVDGAPVSFESTDRKLLIHLAAPLNSGQGATVAVAYETTPRRGLYFIAPDEGYPDKRRHAWTQGEMEDGRFWFPGYDYPNEKATSEVIATVPEPYFVLSNGKLLETRHDQEGGTKTYHWSQDQPHAPYLITLVAGEYAQVHEEWDGIPIDYYVPPGREDDGLRCFGATPDMVRHFSEMIGVRFVWNKYAQITVSDFIFGAMENTTATTMTENMLHDARAHLDFSADGIVAHELAHQWFGDLVTCRDWSHGWLNEGFATYFDALYTEHHKGRDEFLVQMRGNAETYLAEDGGHYRRPLVTNVYNDPMDMFDRHLYEKGSLVLHMLRNVLGDVLWWKAINHYVTKHQYQWVVTADLQRAIEESTGRNLDWFFQQWVFQAGHPEYKVEYSWDDATHLARVRIEQTQKTDHGTPLFRMPIDLRFTTDSGDQTVTVQVNDKEQSFYFSLPSKPRMVRFDPDFKVLKTLDFAPGKDLLLTQLRQAPDALGRIAAAEGLAKIGTPDVVEPLNDALRHDSFWAVQAAAARALGQIKTPAALAAVLQGVNLEHPKARRAVMSALGEWKDAAAADALLRVLEAGDASYYVEASAAYALGRTKDGRAFEALVAVLNGKDSHMDVIRTMAFDGLAELKDARAIDVALEWSAYGKPMRVRERAVAALGRLSGEFPDRKQELLDRLIDLLEDPWLRLKTEAAAAVEACKDARAIPRAREAVQALRRGGQETEEVKKLRTDLEKALDENRKLRDRLDKIEARLDAPIPVS